jgi:Pathogenicity locus
MSFEIFSLKNPDRKTVVTLTELPNIGPAMAEDLRLVGIKQPQDLINKDPYQLYEILCRKTATRHDSCVIDVFLAAVDFMEGGKATPWWNFTAQRKRYLADV